MEADFDWQEGLVDVTDPLSNGQIIVEETQANKDTVVIQLSLWCV